MNILLCTRVNHWRRRVLDVCCGVWERNCFIQRSVTHTANDLYCQNLEKSEPVTFSENMSFSTKLTITNKHIFFWSYIYNSPLSNVIMKCFLTLTFYSEDSLDLHWWTSSSNLFWLAGWSKDYWAQDNNTRNSNEHRIFIKVHSNKILIYCTTICFFIILVL